jgi:cell division protein FtsZ
MTHGDYAGLDTPTVKRQRAVGDGLRPEPAAAMPAEDLLDIPAFLRRQAD